MIWPVTLWIDPGEDTGLAWLWDGGHAFFADEYKFMEAGDHIEDTCARYGPALALGYERYDPDPARPQKDAHHALFMIGIARRYAIQHRCHRLKPALPGQRKTATRQLLQEFGWWVPGKNDAQAAAQHMAAYLIRSGNLPPRESAILSAQAGNI